jgi:hypothetical protein
MKSAARSVCATAEAVSAEGSRIRRYYEEVRAGVEHTKPDPRLTVFKRCVVD